MKNLLAILLFFVFQVVAASPSNDNFESAELLSGLTVTRSGSNQDATSQDGEPGILHNSPQTTVWFKWTAPADGLLTVSTAGSSFDTLLGVFAGPSVDTLTTLAQNDDARDATSLVSLLVTNGVAYSICVDGYEGGTGMLQLSLTLQTGIARPPNDNYTNATHLTGSNIVISASNFLATSEPGELTPTTYGGASVWWTWDAPAAGRYVITTEGSSFDTILAVYLGRNLLVWNDNTETNFNSSVHILNALPGARYTISVQGYAAAAGSIHLEIRPAPQPPAPPWTFAVYNGGTATSTNYYGKVLLLNFWASWCQPCLDEIPTLIALQDKYGPEGFDVIGISTDAHDFDSLGAMIDQYNVNYAMTIMTAELEQGYGSIPFIPTTILIDRNNFIVERYPSAQTASTLDEAIRQLVTLPASLQVSAQGNQIALRWPASATGYHLQSAANPLSFDWTNLNALVTLSEDQNLVTLPATNAARCFRLIRN